MVTATYPNLNTSRTTNLPTKTLQVFFGRGKTMCVSNENSIDLHLKIPVLGQDSRERIISQSGKIYSKFGFQLIESELYLAGALVKEIDFPLEKAAYEVYMDFLELTKEWNLFRVWNYVPYINNQTSALENYKSFCKGRALAFEAFYGPDFEVKLPAASAVGINDRKLVLYFMAGKTAGTHIENPEQVSAFKYPQKYGPKSPSFARGTLIDLAGKRVGYLSGTASIKSHESVTLSDVAQQMHTTLDNMSLVFNNMGLVFERMSFGGLLPDSAKYNRFFKVYIRHETDAKIIRELFPQIILASEEDRIIYLRSDICRSELDIEIEAIIQEK